MILLDTNVVSALMRDPADQDIIDFLDAQNPPEVWTTVVSVFEIRFGLARLPAGRRREALETAFASVLREDLAERIVPLDRAAAEAAGRLSAQREQEGRLVDIRDTLIAGIALTRGAVVATRNTRHFVDLENGVVDPWAWAAATRG